MKRVLSRGRVAAVAIVTVLAAGLAGPWPAVAASVGAVAEHGEVKAALEVLDAWIEATVRSRQQPGLSIGVVHDQELIWAKGYGFADPESRHPATPDTLYRIASISKTFTATAILQLRDAGKLRLDDPVADHLPWFGIRNVHADGPAVTIRHLVTHTSGLPREARGTHWSELTFPTREEMVRSLPEQETILAAETEWKYSNLALALAGEIVSAVSGEPWPRYVENHILRPLAMNATVALPTEGMPGLATGYGRRVPEQPRDVEPFIDLNAVRAAGNMASSVRDLARFVSLQFRDGPGADAPILRGSTVREMHRPQWLHPDWSGGWALGFSVRRVDDQVRLGHGGAVPGHRTQMEFAPADRLGVIVLTNANDGEPMRYVNQAFQLLTSAVRRAAAPPPEPSMPDPAWENYVGTYAWKHSEVRVMLLDGELVMVTPESDDPWGGRMILEPVGPHTFRLGAVGPTYGAIGEELRFEVDARGRVTRMGTENWYFVRKP